jgi:hypothetical protein
MLSNRSVPLCPASGVARPCLGRLPPFHMVAVKVAALCVALTASAAVARAQSGDPRPIITKVTSPSSTQLTISWFAGPIDNHPPLIRVYRDGGMVAKVAADNSDYTDSGLQPDRIYEYRLIADYPDLGVSYPSFPVNGRTLLDRPPPSLRSPTITGNSVDGRYVIIRWQSPDHYDKYLVRYWPKGQEGNAGQYDVNSGGNDGSSKLTLQPATTYLIEVKGGQGGFLGYKYGPWSAPIEVTTEGGTPPPLPPLPAPPEAPTGVDAVSFHPMTENRDVFVTWNPSANADGYRIEFWSGTDPREEKAAALSTTVDRSTTQIKPSSRGATDGIKTMYRVIAYNKGGDAPAASVTERLSRAGANMTPLAPSVQAVLQPTGPQPLPGGRSNAQQPQGSRPLVQVNPGDYGSSSIPTAVATPAFQPPIKPTQTALPGPQAGQVMKTHFPTTVKPDGADVGPRPAATPPPPPTIRLYRPGRPSGPTDRGVQVIR